VDEVAFAVDDVAVGATAARREAVVRAAAEDALRAPVEPARADVPPGTSKSGTYGLRSSTGVPASRSMPSTTTASSSTETIRASERPTGIRPPRRAGREGAVRRVVEERRDGRIPARRLVQVREHPEVREAFEVVEAAAVRLEHLDPRLAARVRDRLEGHAVEVRVRRGDEADRAVDDRLDGSPVEQGLDERQCGTDDREAPEDERPLELGGRPSLALERQLRPCEQ
jgi:hypothetical protein